MKKQKMQNSNKGITLIALVITIIVMLILVAVTISMAINGGLFQKAGEAVGETQNKIDEEQILASGRVQIDGVWYASIDDYVNNKPEPTAVYAKLYDDGTFILSSTDYTDPTRTVSEDYGDVSNWTDYEIPYVGDYSNWLPPHLYGNSTKVITQVIIKDKIVPQKIDGWFCSMSNLETLDLTNMDTSLITSMDYLFSGCTSLKSLNISNWDTSNVTSMKYMFGGSAGPNKNTGVESLNLSNFDTSKVTDMTGMFSDCISLTELDLSNFNTNNVSNMSYMFARCESLTSMDLRNFNTKNVTDMSWMFSNCPSLASVDLSNFNTSNVSNMSYMFSYRSGLTSLDLSNFNTQNVTSYTSMFGSVTAPVYIGSNWNSVMTESATSYSGTFQTK